MCQVSSFLCRRKFNRGSFTPNFRQRLRDQNTSVEIRLIELTERSDTLNCKPFFKHSILQTILHVFYCLYLCGRKPFVLKTELHFILF